MAKIRLYCLPYAGGSAQIFKSWQAYFLQNIEICPVESPGYGARFQEKPIGDYCELVEYLAKTIRDDFRRAQQLNPDLQMAIFGHSAGARFGFGVAARLELESAIRPICCFLSAVSPPHRALTEKKRSLLKDEDLFAELHLLGGTPNNIPLSAIKLYLPQIRETCRATEGSHADQNAKVSIPLTLMAAKRDASVLIDSVWEWSDYTSGPCQQVLLEGDHFSVIRFPQELIAYIRVGLNKWMVS